jgi:hypothetical protein
MWRKLHSRRTQLGQWLQQPVGIAPLVTFRLLFGALTLFSSLRFLALDWVTYQYESAPFKFSYYGWEWVQYPGTTGMYALYGLMIAASIGILLGAWYRLSALVFALSFTYVELIDKTYYLNHYYFVSLVAALMVVLPAHRHFSVDTWRRPQWAVSAVPRWTIGLLKLQIAVVYTYAGIAKINTDWLLEALPLRIWLPAQDQTPLIGQFLHLPWVAYVFSWAGMLFDCFIIAFLAWRRTRLLAYAAILSFHALTGYWFQIGVFPLVMSAITLLFFSQAFHARLLRRLGAKKPLSRLSLAKNYGRYLWPVLILYAVFQLAYPWRYLCYDGNLFWHEAGYRFSWRVMLVEKSGDATFYVRDGATGPKRIVVNSDFLNRHQEKQMSFQPDMILQYAHLLADHYRKQGMRDPQVFADVYVTMNGRPGRPMVDPTVNLAAQPERFHPYPWVLPYAH